jgi:hypothetical protein
VYEDEASLFSEDRSKQGITDDLFERLLTFPNVLVTGNQAFFTKEAMTAIAQTMQISEIKFLATCFFRRMRAITQRLVLRVPAAAQSDTVAHVVLESIYADHTNTTA